MSTVCQLLAHCRLVNKVVYKQVILKHNTTHSIIILFKITEQKNAGTNTAVDMGVENNCKNV